MTDDEIDASIQNDHDSFTKEGGEWLGRASDRHRYYLYWDYKAFWYWRLIDADGETVAVSAHPFESRTAALAAIEALRDATRAADTRDAA